MVTNVKSYQELVYLTLIVRNFMFISHEIKISSYNAFREITVSTQRRFRYAIFQK